MGVVFVVIVLVFLGSYVFSGKVWSGGLGFS